MIAAPRERTDAARPLRALAALLRVGVLEAVSYRAQTIVWILTTTMPLIMLALFGAALRERPLGHYDEAKLVAYFLATFIVRQLTSSWVAWQISQEVRDGTLATRLLRPVHPLLSYAADSVATLPLRSAVAIPALLLLVALVGARELSSDPAIWLLWLVSLAGASLISLFVSMSIGALAFFMESSTKAMDVWLAFLFVFSGYLVPVDLFPIGLREALDYLPFRYQIGLPVELMTGAHGRGAALALVLRQWAFVALAALVTRSLWRRGLVRFAAYGG
jgi:ABC-2 type transport system permease protein